jgi:nitroreductase
MDHSRLSMPLGEAIFTQRSIRRFTPDPIPLEDVQLLDEGFAAPDDLPELFRPRRAWPIGCRTRRASSSR